LATEFAQIAASGATVVRTWFFQREGGMLKTFADYDRVLAAAKTAGLLVIPALVNQWDSPTGSLPDYRQLGWYQGGYATTPDYGVSQTFRSFAVSMAERYARNP